MPAVVVVFSVGECLALVDAQWNRLEVDGYKGSFESLEQRRRCNIYTRREANGYNASCTENTKEQSMYVSEKFSTPFG